MSNASSPAVTPLTPAEVDVLERSPKLTDFELQLFATVRDRERQRDIAWRSSEDWERQSKLYEKERDELQRQLEQEANDHNSIQVQTEHERNAFQAKSDELQRQLAEADRIERGEGEKPFKDRQ